MNERATLAAQQIRATRDVMAEQGYLREWVEMVLDVGSVHGGV